MRLNNLVLRPLSASRKFGSVCISLPKKPTQFLKFSHRHASFDNFPKESVRESGNWTCHANRHSQVAGCKPDEPPNDTTLATLGSDPVYGFEQPVIEAYTAGPGPTRAHVRANKFIATLKRPLQRIVKTPAHGATHKNSHGFRYSFASTTASPQNH